METVQKIFASLQGITKPQRKFLLGLFTTILTLRGRVNFRNMSRYSEVSEKTFSRQFAKPFDFVAFNRHTITAAFGTDSERIVAFDPSFVPKSGPKTYGRDYFWNGCHRRAEKGLEVSAIAMVDIEKNTGLTLSVRQTVPLPTSPVATSPPCQGEQPSPVGKKTTTKSGKKTTTKSGKKTIPRHAPDDDTLMDQYLHHVRELRPALLPSECYVVADGNFAKKKYVDGVCALSLHLVSKLRCDANMRYLYTGPLRPSGSGRQKTYDGKVNWQDLSRFEYVTTEDGIDLYTQILNHVTLKRTVRVVVLLDQSDPQKPRYVLVFTTDLTVPALTIYRYYKARFQIEFLFRDAKQFTGLCDCQARDQARLDFHFHASLATLNVAKLEELQAHPGPAPLVYSLASVKARYFNAHYLHKIFSMLGVDPNLMKKSSAYQKLRDYGSIDA
jgi:hypothetical protein